MFMESMWYYQHSCNRVTFYPYKKKGGGALKVPSREPEVLAIMKGGGE